MFVKKVASALSHDEVKITARDIVDWLKNGHDVIEQNEILKAVKSNLIADRKEQITAHQSAIDKIRDSLSELETN